MKMKIVFLTEWFFPIGGIEACVWEWVNKLAFKHEVHLLIFYHGKGDLKTSSKKGLKIINVSGKSVKNLKSIIKEIDPDIIHSQHLTKIGFVGLLVAKKMKIPFVVTSHQIPEYNQNSFLNYLTWKYLVWLNNKCSMVIAPSQTVKKILLKNKVRTNIKVISNGVDTDIFIPQRSKSMKETILFVGRFSKEKGLKTLVKAAKIVLQKRKDVSFTLIGFPGGIKKHDFSDNLIRLIQKKDIQKHFNIVNFLPPKSKELISYYQKSSVFVIPSYFETQSLVTLEAMACGLPIIASNAGALPELVKEGVNGFLFERDNYEQLAERINYILERKTKREQMGVISRKFSINHGIKKTVEAYEKVYVELINHTKV